MKAIHKIPAALMAVCMLASLFAGCANSGTATATAAARTGRGSFAPPFAEITEALQQRGMTVVRGTH